MKFHQKCGYFFEWDLQRWWVVLFAFLRICVTTKFWEKDDSPIFFDEYVSLGEENQQLGIYQGSWKNTQIGRNKELREKVVISGEFAVNLTDPPETPKIINHFKRSIKKKLWDTSVKPNSQLAPQKKVVVLLFIIDPFGANFLGRSRLPLWVLGRSKKKNFPPVNYTLED